MIDIKVFTEKKEELNGIYLEALSKRNFSEEQKAAFLKVVDELFHMRSGTGMRNPLELYETVIEQAYSVAIKEQKRAITIFNKKLLKRRGNVIWDSKKGTYRK